MRLGRNELIFWKIFDTLISANCPTRERKCLPKIALKTKTFCIYFLNAENKRLQKTSRIIYTS